MHEEFLMQSRLSMAQPYTEKLHFIYIYEGVEVEVMINIAMALDIIIA